MTSRYGKAELMRDIETNWTKLNANLDALTHEQLFHLRDAVGWTVKDHVTHLTAWERSVVLFLQGQPRYVGLGVDQPLFVSGDLDRLNAAIQQQGEALSLDEARAGSKAVHSQMLRLLEPLSDEDLLKSNSEFAPSVSGDFDTQPIIQTIYMNTTEHYEEHLAWIEILISKGQ